jgi:hypothetical protein
MYQGLKKSACKNFKSGLKTQSGSTACDRKIQTVLKVNGLCSYTVCIIFYTTVNFYLIGYPTRAAASARTAAASAGTTAASAGTTAAFAAAPAAADSRVRAAADFKNRSDKEIERGNTGVFGNHTFNSRAELCGKRVECVAANHSVVDRICTAVTIFRRAIVAAAAGITAGITTRITR